MARCAQRFALVAALGLILVACASPPGGTTPRDQETQPTAQKRLVAAVNSEPPGMHLQLTQPNIGSAPGLPELWQILGAGLTYLDDDDVVHPLLAEAAPSTENGGWKVLPDGRMEVAWQLKPNLSWHDGTPLTAEDVVFSFAFQNARDVGIVIPAFNRLVDRIEAHDSRTVVTYWSAPFTGADRMFTGAAAPLPKHILGPEFDGDRSNVLNHPFWNERFVGAGPYKLQQWHIGTHITLVANDSYALGRPRIDEVEVRFMHDLNTIMANLLSGSIQTLIGRGFVIEQAMQIRDISRDINVQTGGKLAAAIPIWPQFINTRPSIVANLEFRRALLMGIDRQEMTDSLQYGLAPIAHSTVAPDSVEHPAIERQIVKYDYDPRRATQMIESLGYTRGSDGVFRDARDEPLAVELWTTDQNTLQPKSAYSVSEYWRRLEIDMSVNNVPNQRITDREYRSQFPAFELVRTTLIGENFRSTNTPLPENGFQGANRTRYMNPAYDAMIDRYFTTIPVQERLAALGDIVRHQTENLIVMTLFYQPGVNVLGSTALKNQTGTRVFNIHLWDLA